MTVTNAAGDSTSLAVQVSTTYLVTFTPGPGGVLLGALSQTPTAGGACTAVTAAASTGCTFAGWTGSGFAATTQNPLTVSNVSRNLDLTANFASITCTLAYVAGPNGSISGLLSQP